MKRKVIQLAGKTHVVSLPSKWVKHYNVSKGDEIELEEQGNTILLKPSKQETELKKISLNIDNFNERTFRYAMSALHKAGYDEITLYHETPKLKEVTQNLIQNLMLGFVVMEQTSKKLVLKNVANEIESEFNPALRRAFLVTISLSNSSLDMIISKQFSNLSSLINLEMSNNQLTSFCLRLMNKGFYKDQDKKIFLATVVWSLEKIGDEYKSICINLTDNKNEINKEIINLYKEVNILFSSYYELFYNFSPEKLNGLSDRKYEINTKINKIKTSTEYETKLLMKLSTIVSKTADLSSSIFALNHEKLK